MKRAKWWMGLLAAVGLAAGTQGPLQASETKVQGNMPPDSSKDFCRGLEPRSGGDLPELYLEVDISGGQSAENWPVCSLDAVPKGGWSDEYKTTKLVLRLLPAGTFIMGSPEDELGRLNFETQHEVTLTHGFWMGVFEVTQRQWELAMGNRPSYFNNNGYYTMRPVEMVSYDDIRGSEAGAKWPDANTVDADSFLGVLRAKTGVDFDLPTEAQWEYACRAGTTTALNSGKNLTSPSNCVNMEAVGRYRYNGGKGYSSSSTTSRGTAYVGSYQPNAWGLYDMHGNVDEWCLDWLGDYDTTHTIDPVGPASPGMAGTRVPRGGGWYCHAQHCRSAVRGSLSPAHPNGEVGFRLCYSAGTLPPSVPPPSPTIVYTGLTKVTVPAGEFSIAFVLKNYTGDYHWTLLGEGGISNDGIYSWTPTEPGTYEIKVGAVDGETLVAEKILTLTVKEPGVIYSVDVAIGIPNGSISADKSGAEEGELVTLSAHPASGYTLDSFLLDGQPLAGHTFLMPAHDVLVSASFAKGSAFVKITSLGELEEGEYIITGTQSEGEEYAMMAAVSTTSTKYLQRREKAVELETDTITDAEDSIIWTLAQGADGWTIYNSDVGYVGYLNSGNSANAEANPSAKSSWSISAAHGLFLLTNVGSTERYLLYNASAPRFSCYTRTSSGKQLALYKLTAVANAIITWTGTTDIEIGETFEVQFSLENYDGDYSWVVQSGDGSISEEGLYTFTPTETGSYGVTVAAVVDGTTLATSETIELSVTEPESATTTGVPYAWLSNYGFGDGTPEGFEAAANATAANGINTVAECYVAGLNPTDKAASFSADISFSNGQPVVTWTPDLNENGTRSYVLEGTPTMTNVWDATNAASRFFRVKVALP